jgi:radical SAM protein with 4Fe4S-binding SPASM domain
LADEESPEADFLLLRTVVDPSEEVWRKARAALLHRHPWLTLEAVLARPVPEAALATPYGAEWLELRRAIRRVAREVAPRPETAGRMHALPGIVPDWIEELQACGSAATSEELARLANCGDQAAAQSRQILLVPTYRCNLTCSYCYAKSFSDGMPPDMPVEDLEFTFGWAAAQGVESVLLAGGEPTVYAHFARLLELAGEWGIAVRLTSNMLYPSVVRGRIAAPAIRELVAHYDQERMEADPAAAGLFEENLRAARASGLGAILRYTLTQRSGPAEWRTVMDLAVRLGISQINYALAFQGSAGRNAYFPVREGIGQDGGRVENVLLGLCDDAARRRIRLHLCKPFPLCLLTRASLRRVLQEGGMTQACAIHGDGYTRNLTVNPDLSTFPCTGIAIRGPKIGELANAAEAGRRHAAAVESLMLQPYAEECRNCALWHRGVCRGACMAEHYWMSRAARTGAAGRP